ncbi:integrase/recombinase xerD homolog [Lacerta agilis]|uniref:integrase/recombinase xerD homolog n=1 Tax=Lacerta agilis TaxID=80427 RepID=UPI00141A2FB7|nr:integrase/recombinase xerD homolog [Lacerta agilis]
MQGVLASVAPSTLRSYTKAWSDFLTYRTQYLRIHQHTPPSTSHVLQYLVHLRNQGRAPKTLKIQAAAISFFAKSMHFHDPCADFVVRRALEGWRRLQPPSVDGRRPITYELLCKIRDKLRSICWSKYEARLFAAAYSIAFFGALRVGEVVHEGDPGPLSRGLQLSDIQLSATELVVYIRRSKTDQRGKGAMVRLPATMQSGPCPVKDTKRFLDLRPPGSGPLLVHEDGSRLARQQFTRVMRMAIGACGLPAKEFAAHSFRIGAATAAFHWGLSTDSIKTLGRWSSNAFKSYIRAGSSV